MIEIEENSSEYIITKTILLTILENNFGKRLDEQEQKFTVTILKNDVKKFKKEYGFRFSEYIEALENYIRKQKLEKLLS